MGSGPGGSRPLASNSTGSPQPVPEPSSSFGAGAIAGAVIGIVVLIILLFAVIFGLRRHHRRKTGRYQNNLGISPTWPGHGVPEEAQKPHVPVIEIDSAPLAEMGGSLRFPVQIANGSTTKLEYYSEDHQDQVHELPADAIAQRQPNRSYSSRAGRRPRNGSMGQDSNISGVSDTDGERGGAGVRPSLSHRRNTSEQSDRSNVSDVSTLQNDGHVSPSVSLGVSPIGVSPLREAQNQMLASSMSAGMPSAEHHMGSESPEGFEGVSPIAERSQAESMPLGLRLQNPAPEPREDSTSSPPTAKLDAGVA